jgi:serine/threonine protein kinase
MQSKRRTSPDRREIPRGGAGGGRGRGRVRSSMDQCEAGSTQGVSWGGMARNPSPPTAILKLSSDDPPAPVRVHGGAHLRPPEGGRYMPQRVLGEGGMGLVRLVSDPVVGRQVALKQLRSDLLTDADALARFDREARLQGQLEHPAIVPVYDVGTAPDGVPFFTMKRVRGQSLADVLHQLASGEPTRFSRRKLLTAFSQLCLAVHYAHERGVVHRDIKPANVMLGPYGEVYLLDWGVAKLADETDGDGRSSAGPIRAADAVHTAFGDIMGTISTMAPEQALAGEIDARTDVYALGAVLFEILTLTPLHPSGEFDDVADQIVKGVEARPSVRAPEADVPPELEELCVAATRVAPGDRIASALLVHEAVEAFLDGDRDLELRRASANKHLEAARAATEELLGDARTAEADDEAGRASALREVGRSLALDPDNRDALAILVRLLTTPPKTTPREVVEEQNADLRRRVRLGGIAAAVVYGYISLNAFSTWQLGVHDLRTFLTAHALWACALAASLVTIWKPTYAALFVTFLFGLVTSVYVTSVYGPFLLVPTLLTMHAVLYSLVRDRWIRIPILVLASLGWTVSVFGELGGLFPNTVHFLNDEISIRSPVIGLPETTTTLYLWASTLAAIIGPGLVVGALRSAWQKNDDAMRVQAWQLRRLVGEGSRRADRAAVEAA